MLQIPRASQLDSTLPLRSRGQFGASTLALPYRGQFGAPTLALPYRGQFGAPRPAALAALPLPPAPMPGHRRGRPLKSWRYVGVFGPELMICVAAVRVGPARQWFWGVWDRTSQRLHERTAIARNPGIRLAPGRVDVDAPGLRLQLVLEEAAGIECVCAAGPAYAWTRKQGGIPATGTIAVGGAAPRRVEARAIIDDTAAYYPRHTRWRWCAGVGLSDGGRQLAWNLVDGVNDPPQDSERTVWVDGVAAEVEPVVITPDLTAVDGLRFSAEAIRARRDNLLIVRSRYRQPFGTFSGRVAGHELRSGFGVMESHDAWW